MCIRDSAWCASYGRETTGWKRPRCRESVVLVSSYSVFSLSKTQLSCYFSKSLKREKNPFCFSHDIPLVHHADIFASAIVGNSSVISQHKNVSLRNGKRGSIVGWMGCKDVYKRQVAARQVEQQTLQIAGNQNIHRGRNCRMEGTAAIVYASTQELRLSLIHI